MELAEDPRTEKPELCGITTMVGPHEFICIHKAHAKIYKRHTRRGIVFDTNPNADRHYFVRRYPTSDH